MKQGIHPHYQDATITCANCGTAFHIQSIKPMLSIDVCSQCHPFFTGRQRLLDAGGRVERFRKRFSLSAVEV